MTAESFLRERPLITKDELGLSNMEVINLIQIFSGILFDYKSSYIILTKWTFNYLL